MSQTCTTRIFYFYNYAQQDIGKQQQQRDFQLVLDKFRPCIT